jgi:trehalose 6-phosphate phosphatase
MTVFPDFPLASHITLPIALPPVERSALLLDLDGTLLDIAPTPDSVVVAPDLPDVLRRLRAACGDALAVITGRPIEQIDDLLGDIPYAVAGEHGGAVRHEPGVAIERIALPLPPDGWLAEAEEVARNHSGVLLERKQRGFVLHYRAVPELRDLLKDFLDQLMAQALDRFMLQAAHMAWEVKPRGADKGTAVTQLMQRAPFSGRVPIFIGDDVTDEDGMHVARATGGVGLRVPDLFGDAVGVRAWLAATAEALPRGEAA